MSMNEDVPDFEAKIVVRFRHRLFYLRRSWAAMLFQNHFLTANGRE